MTERVGWTKRKDELNNPGRNLSVWVRKQWVWFNVTQRY